MTTLQESNFARYRVNPRGHRGQTTSKHKQARTLFIYIWNVRCWNHRKILREMAGNISYPRVTLCTISKQISKFYLIRLLLIMADMVIYVFLPGNDGGTIIHCRTECVLVNIHKKYNFQRFLKSNMAPWSWVLWSWHTMSQLCRVKILSQYRLFAWRSKVSGFHQPYHWPSFFGILSGIFRV